MKLPLGAILLSLSLVPSMAQAASEIALAPSSADDAQIDRLIDPFLTSLRNGQTKKAITDYMGTNAMTASKMAEFDYVAVQTDAAVAAYGKFGDCQLTEKNSNGSWAQSRVYLCQHEKYMTRWLFTVIKLRGTWQAATFRFDDKFTLNGSQQ